MAGDKKAPYMPQPRSGHEETGPDTNRALQKDNIPPPPKKRHIALSTVQPPSRKTIRDTKYFCDFREKHQEITDSTELRGGSHPCSMKTA